MHLVRTLISLLFLMLATMAAHVMADGMPPWWEKTIRVVPAEGGVSLFRTGDGELVADGLKSIFPLARFVSAWRGDKQGVIGEDGRLLVPFEYDRIDSHEDLGVFVVKRGESWGVLGYDGSIRLPVSYDAIIDQGGPGVPWAVWQGDLRGLADPVSGQLLLPLEYSELYVLPPFVSAARQQGEGWQATKTWFVYDLAGHPIPGVGPEAGHAVWEETGLLVVDGQRVVDPAGQEIIPAGLFDSIRPAGQLAIVSRENRRGLIDRHGNLLTPIRYAEMWMLTTQGEGLIGVREVDAETGALHSGALDMLGNTLVEPHWDRLEHHVARRDGVETPYFLVSLDGKTGSLNAKGETLFPPRFDEAHAMDYGDPVYLVTAEGRSGLCDLSNGSCPVPVSYSSLLPSDISPGDDLYLAESEGKYGIVSDSNQLVVPMLFDWIKGLPRKALENADVEASLQFVVTRYRLQRDETGQWTSSIVAGSPIGEQAYDQHPLAVKIKPVLDARYLPEGMVSDANVLAAARAGRLREAVFPSIQIAGRAAYANFNRFVREGQEALAEAMVYCREGEGFRLLTDVDPEDKVTGACEAKDPAALLFEPAGEGAMLCSGCQALGLPERWLRKDPPVIDACGPANVRLSGWSVASARERYADWLARWRREMPSLLAVQSGTEAAATTPYDPRQGSLLQDSRAYSTVAVLLLDPQRLAGLLEDPSAQIDWHGLINRFSALLESAEPMREGGIYPETDAKFAGTCAEVWYMKVPAAEAALADGRTIHGLHDYALPAKGEFKRNAYPFLTFVREAQGLRLAGISREFLQTLMWLEAERCRQTGTGAAGCTADQE